MDAWHAQVKQTASHVMQTKIGKMILQTIYVDVKNIFHKIVELVINVELDVQDVIRLNV